MTADELGTICAKIVLGFIIAAVLSVAGCCLWDIHWLKESARQKFKQQIGTYALDVKMTRLGSYAKDSLLYKKLRITFRKDSTFHLNFQVPFIADTEGRWNCDGIEDLQYRNYMYFKKWGYDKFELKKGVEFSTLWAIDSDLEKGIDQGLRRGNDSVFLIDGCYAQFIHDCVKDIWFVKLSRQE